MTDAPLKLDRPEERDWAAVWSAMRGKVCWC